MSDTLRIGTRGSRLALWQAHHVKSLLEAAWDGLVVEIVEISTRGDRDRTVALGTAGGIGFFTKEIEHALLESEVDVAVHSLKDLPTTLVPGLVLGAVPEREDSRDVLIGRPGVVDSPDDLRDGVRVATSSPRRKGQLLAAFPGIVVEPIRGNVPTRIEKVRAEGRPDATILALAGLRRLGLTDAVTAILPHDTVMGAVGQGALGIEIREGDERAARLVGPLNDPDTRVSVESERAFLARLEGGCTVPAGASANVREDGTVTIFGVVADPEGGEVVRDWTNDTGSRAGEKLAEKLLAKGADRILARLREEAP